ncbi:MAG: ribonuclease HII [Candidatus Wallbacteria bacterium]|nr:ribonuclease HII [Candidatus Wallbacteria bacterium]
MQFSEIELELKKRGFCAVAGMDEAGRGPLAGPVVAACVILRADFDLEGVRDSKKLSDSARRKLYPGIITRAVGYSFGISSREEIDDLNILKATKKAMLKAFGGLGLRPDYLLIDAVKLGDLGIPYQSLIRGEDKSLSIAAASILAKVHRDDLMLELGQKYPAYGFAAHKGYGTLDHLLAISLYGPCPEHRKTFEPVKSGLFPPLFYQFWKRAKTLRSMPALEALEGEITESGFEPRELSAIGKICRDARDRLERKETEAKLGFGK